MRCKDLEAPTSPHDCRPLQSTSIRHRNIYVDSADGAESQVKPVVWMLKSNRSVILDAVMGHQVREMNRRRRSGLEFLNTTPDHLQTPLRA